MTSSDDLESAPRSLLEIGMEIMWEDVQRVSPWQFVLGAAGWSPLGTGEWAKDGLEARLNIEGTGWGSHLLGADDPSVWSRPGIWTCDQVWIYWVHGGDVAAAGLALLQTVLDQVAGGEARLPERLVDKIVEGWDRCTITPAGLEVNMRESDLADVFSKGAASPLAELSGTFEQPAEKYAVAPMVKAAVEGLHETDQQQRSGSAVGMAGGYGCAPLDSILHFLMRFLVLPEPSNYVALTPWVAHTYLLDKFQVTPRLAVLSPEPQSGKTRVLDLLKVLALNPVQTVDLTPASLFRKVDVAKGQVTLLLDEVDTIFGPGGSSSDQIKSLVNGGYRRGATVMRSGSKQKGFTPEEFEIFAPVAMAGLGSLPGPLLSRCVVIGMRKRTPGELVQNYRPGDVVQETADLRVELSAWAAGVRDALARPRMPDAVTDRAAEIWEPLLTVAAAASPGWFVAACVAAVTAVTGPEKTVSSQTKLLEAIRSSFDLLGKPKVRTEKLLKMLSEDDGVPHEYVDAKRLAHALSGYGIGPKPMRFGKKNEKVKRGYDRRDFEDAWSRYLPGAATAVTPATAPEEPLE